MDGTNMTEYCSIGGLMIKKQIRGNIEELFKLEICNLHQLM